MNDVISFALSNSQKCLFCCQLFAKKKNKTNNSPAPFPPDRNSFTCWCLRRRHTQYYKQSVLYKETLHYMNTAFTALFSIECMLKIISFGVRVSKPIPSAILI